MGCQLEIAAPESVGVAPAALLKTLRDLAEIDSINSIMVLRHGKQCFAAWWKPFAPELPHILFSLSKSFTSTAIAFARAEGKLELSDRLTGFFPEYSDAVTDPVMREVTLRDLLTMRSGHASCIVRSHLIPAPDGDWVRAFLASRLDCKPGTRFVYNSAATYMLASVVRRVTGENVREYLIPRLFDLLDIQPGPWECCPRGTNFGGWGFYLKTADIAKTGQLLLRKGRLGDRQVLPWDYFAEATVKQADNSMNNTPDWQSGYGYQFWVSRHGYRGDGASGQFMIVLPEYDMTIAMTSGCDNLQRVLDVLWDDLLPGVSDSPVAADPAAAAELERFAATLAIPLASGNLTRRHAPARFEFKANFAGIRAACVTFDSDRVAVDFEFESGRIERLTCGFGFNCRSTVQLTDPLPRIVESSAAWVEDNQLEIQCCCCETSFRDVYHIDFGSSDRPFYRTSRFGTFRAPFPELEVVTQN